MSHLVVRSAKLEGEDRLKVFSLEEDLAFESIAEVHSMSQWRCLNDIVHFCC